MNVHDTERIPKNVIDAPGRKGDSHGFGFRAKHYENAVVFFLLFTIKFFHPYFPIRTCCFAFGETSFSILTIKSHYGPSRSRNTAKFDERSLSVIFLVYYSRFDFLDFSTDFFG